MKNSISKCWRYSARVLHYWFNINANLCLHSNAVLKQAFVCGDVTEHAAATRAQARLRATYEGLPPAQLLSTPHCGSHSRYVRFMLPPDCSSSGCQAAAGRSGRCGCRGVAAPAAAAAGARCRRG